MLVLGLVLPIAASFALSFVRRPPDRGVMGFLEGITSTAPIDQIAAALRSTDRPTRTRATTQLYYYPHSTVTKADATLIAHALIDNPSIDRAEATRLRYAIGTSSPLVAEVLADVYTRTLLAGDRARMSRVLTVSSSVVRRFDGVDDPDPNEVLHELQRVAAGR